VAVVVVLVLLRQTHQAHQLPAVLVLHRQSQAQVSPVLAAAAAAGITEELRQAQAGPGAAALDHMEAVLLAQPIPAAAAGPAGTTVVHGVTVRPAALAL
jgi:hypothetical protein